MLWRIVKFSFRHKRLVFGIPLLYLLLSVGYYFLPWSVQSPVYRRMPALHRTLQKSGFNIMQGWDELALVGRDTAVPIDSPELSRRIYAGYPKQGFKLFGRTELLENEGYDVGYSDSMHCPLWVVYRIFDVTNLDSGKRPSNFRIDNRTDARVRPGDYTHSGYDRGHMAPNYGIATRYGAEAQRETFLMSNVIPQEPYVNRGIWKDLEMRIARKYGRYFSEVWIITGPVFSESPEKLESGIPIPSHYYKIIADEHADELRTLAFLIEADLPPYTRVKTRLVSIDEIEERTGLDFFPNLPDEIQVNLESEPASRLWPWLLPAFQYHFSDKTF